MLDYVALAEWFTDAGIVNPFHYDHMPLESRDNPEGQPHRVHVLSITGGLGLTVEQAFDRITFQVMTRSAPENRGGQAFYDAMAVDDAWLDAAPGFDLGGYWVVDKGRFGGPPAYVATDDRKRVLRAATYYLEIAR